MGAVEGLAGGPGGEQLGEPGAEGLLGGGAGGSQESNSEHHIHIIDFYIYMLVQLCRYGLLQSSDL